MRVLFVFTLWCASVLTACFGEPNHAVLSSMDFSKICMDGGAILDLTNGECLCPGGVPWDGVTCGGIPTAASRTPDGLEEASPIAKDSVPEDHRAVYETLPKDGKSETASEEMGPPSLAKPSVPSRAAQAAMLTAKTDPGSDQPVTTGDGQSSPQKTAKTDPDQPSKGEGSAPVPVDRGAEPPQGVAHAKQETHAPMETHPKPEGPRIEPPVKKGSIRPTDAIQKSCALAQGEWIARDSYCHCPGGRVLVGQTCVQLRGKLTATECRSATRPGTWRKGACACGVEGQRFSLSRGGCTSFSLQETSFSPATQRRVCESSLHRGIWDGRKNLCNCPVGHIWHHEECRVQSSLTSRQVCTSDFNRGQWDSARKRCLCPAGAVWLDQRCHVATAVSDAAACESEANHGRWTIAARSCRCPDGKTWVRSTKTCS